MTSDTNNTTDTQLLLFDTRIHIHLHTHTHAWQQRRRRKMMKTNCYALGYRVFKFYFQFTHSRMLGFSWSTKSWPVVHIRITRATRTRTHTNTWSQDTYIHTYTRIYTLQIAADVDSTTKYDIRHFQYLRTFERAFLRRSGSISRTCENFSYKNLIVRSYLDQRARFFKTRKKRGNERRSTRFDRGSERGERRE